MNLRDSIRDSIFSITPIRGNHWGRREKLFIIHQLTLKEDGKHVGLVIEYMGERGSTINVIFHRQVEKNVLLARVYFTRFEYAVLYAEEVWKGNVR